MLWVLDEAQELFEYTRKLRQEFHRYPELGFQEVRTAEIITRELNNLGIEAKTGIAKTGIVAHITGETSGPVGLLRFDMDALPIYENTNLDYSSVNHGVMHACGHDGHMAIGLTVAKILNQHRNRISGVVKIVFQPAEEGLGGALGMISEGILINPRPDLSIGLHLWNEKPVGWLGITSGPVMAAGDIFKVHIKGRGGHGALPHQTRDPIMAGAQTITSLQSIVSRNIAPQKSAVVSVTKILAGESFNVVPSDLELLGTIRTFETEIRDRVLERFNNIVSNTSKLYECEAAIEIQSITPTLVNDPEISKIVQNIAEKLFPTHQIDTEYRTMGSEDMAFIQEEIPGCYFFIGSSNEFKGLNAMHHNPNFNFDEQVLPDAVALMAASTFRILS